MPKIQIAPSILSADFSRLAEEILAVEKAGADYIHIDVMDGHFVPNITIGPLVVQAVKKVTSLPLDVHLMIEKPERYIEAFVLAGASLLTVHVEACVHLHRTIQRISELGAIPGVSLNPSTPISAIYPVLPYVRLVLVMTVNPGFGGQKFIPGMVEKIKTLSGVIAENRLDVSISVDGGLNLQTAEISAKAGANVIVAGSFIFESPDYQERIAGLKNAALQS